MKKHIRLIIRTAILLIAVTSFIFLEKPSPPISVTSSMATSTAQTSSDHESNDITVDSDISSSATDTDTDTDTVPTNATVLHVVDGDTLDADLDGVGKVRIRLLGVNTPETVDPRKPVECFGKAASNFSKKMMLVGDRIQLEADPQADERDKYGRLLRNIILANGTDYNALLVEKGYAHAYLGFPLDPQRKVQLKRLETEAKTAGRGLWGADCQ